MSEYKYERKTFARSDEAAVEIPDNAVGITVGCPATRVVVDYLVPVEAEADG